MSSLKLRSMLFVPADSERKLAKSMQSTADALILDLEDSVAESRKAGARGTAADFIRAQAETLASRIFVRINPLDTALAMHDLAAVVTPGLGACAAEGVTSARRLDRFGACP